MYRFIKSLREWIYESDCSDGSGVSGGDRGGDNHGNVDDKFGRVLDVQSTLAFA
jgi:hypothetical protein